MGDAQLEEVKMGTLQNAITLLWIIVLSSLAVGYVDVTPVIERTVFAVGSLLRTGAL